MKSVKGKKWKERISLKKAAKKNTSNRPQNELSLDHDSALCDDEQEQVVESVDVNILNTPIVDKSSEDAIKEVAGNEESKDDCDTEHIKAIEGEQGQVNESVDKSILDTPIVEKSSKDAPEKAPDNEGSEDDGGTGDVNAIKHVGIINSAQGTTDEKKISSGISTTQNPQNTDFDTPDNCRDVKEVSEELKSVSEAISYEKNEDDRTLDSDPKTIQDENVVSEELKVSCMVSVAEIAKDDSDAMVGGVDTSTFAIDDEERSPIDELPSSLDNENDENIIQGIPPNKGKKWKDRLKKKKQRKSSKSGAVKKDANQVQQMLSDSPSNSLGASSTYSENSSGRPSYKRCISDLTAPPEEKLRPISVPIEEGQTEPPLVEEQTEPLLVEEQTEPPLVEEQTEPILVEEQTEPPLVEEQTEPPLVEEQTEPLLVEEQTAPLSVEEQTEPPLVDERIELPLVDKQTEPPLVDEQIDPKNGRRKSNKWKNRLAKMKTSKQDSMRSLQPDAKTMVLDAASGVAQTSDDLNPLDDPPLKTLEPISEPSICKEVHAIEETNISTPIDKNEVPSPKFSSERPCPSNTVPEDNPPSQWGNTSSQTEPNKQDSDIHRDLRQSFNVFDAFLKGPVDKKTIDDESIYTELTIGQESMLQSATPDYQIPFEEEEQSYMDFTMEESLQPSFVDQTIVSRVAPKDQMISPFMSNLLSSRMFQDVVPPISLKSMQQEHEKPQRQQDEAIERADESTKQFPTITVGNFDDDMTQLTMGSFEEEDDDNGNQDHAEDQFFDAVTMHVSITSSAKSFGKKSGISTNSRRSGSGISVGSQVSCSESSKQRIAEILRKELWSSDKNTVERAIQELDIEAKKGFNFRAHIVRCGGIMTIMKAMEMNSSCESILIPCCSTLEKLALEPQNQVAVCEMEGISLIVRSMQHHADSAKLQESACAALATICRQQEANTSQDPMKDAEGAVPILLSCMTRHPTNSIIQAKAFGAISSLCTGSHSHERLAEMSKAGGIMTLTMALQTPWESKNDQHEAISNLSILLRGIAELNEKKLSLLTEEETSKDAKQDGTSRTSNETESVSTRKDDTIETKGNDTTANKSKDHIKGEKTPNDDYDESQDSYIEEIPDIPILASCSSNHEDIPDLGELPTMMSNLEWQNNDPNDPNSADKKIMSPDRLDGSKQDNEEQCTIQ